MPPIDFPARRQLLLDELRREGITDPRTLAAMNQVPREQFVPAHLQASAYDNNALPLGHEQTISQPYIVALMTESLRLSDSDRVLDVGTGSGYQAAILAHLCREVITIERIEPLARHARLVLSNLGLTNLTSLIGDGSQGAEDYAPFDAILVAATCREVPPNLIRQLAPGGRLVLPLGEPGGLQTLMRYEKLPTGELQTTTLCPCRFVPLIESDGFSDTP